MQTSKFVVREQEGGKVEMAVFSEDPAGSGTEFERQMVANIVNIVQWVVGEFWKEQGQQEELAVWDAPPPHVVKRVADHFKQEGGR